MTRPINSDLSGGAGEYPNQRGQSNQPEVVISDKSKEALSGRNEATRRAVQNAWLCITR